MVIDLYDLHAFLATGNVHRFTITDNSLILNGELPQLTVGSGYIVIACPDGGVLPMLISHG